MNETSGIKIILEYVAYIGNTYYINTFLPML